MPELPEVETVRRGLKGFILGAKLKKVEVICDGSAEGDFAQVVGAKVADLRRFGKALIVDFNNGFSLMIHLRMTGQLIFDGVGRFAAGQEEVKLGKTERFAAGHPNENFVAQLPNGQTRVILEFERGVLYFNDQRKFGFIKVLKTVEVEKEPFIAKLGKEPWEMSAEELLEKLQRRKNSAVKTVILDQKVVAGLGNIYADESLFSAGILPMRKAGSLSLAEAEKLLVAMREVMEKSLEAGGSTLKNYVKADGTRGDYLDLFAKIYNRAGKSCMNCGEAILKTKVNGRGTHYCPRCQK